MVSWTAYTGERPAVDGNAYKCSPTSKPGQHSSNIKQRRAKMLQAYCN
jgi:hypothetical protein